jgi:hypothetical protein
MNKSLLLLINGIVVGFFLASLIDFYRMPDKNRTHEVLYQAKAKQKSELNSEIADVAEYLFNKTQVLCVVMTDMNSYKDRGFNIEDTWGKRCNKIMFFSDKIGECFELKSKLQSTKFKEA